MKMTATTRRAVLGGLGAGFAGAVRLELSRMGQACSWAEPVTNHVCRDG